MSLLTTSRPRTDPVITTVRALADGLILTDHHSRRKDVHDTEVVDLLHRDTVRILKDLDLALVHHFVSESLALRVHFAMVALTDLDLGLVPQKSSIIVSVSPVGTENVGLVHDLVLQIITDVGIVLLDTKGTAGLLLDLQSILLVGPEHHFVALLGLMAVMVLDHRLHRPGRHHIISDAIHLRPLTPLAIIAVYLTLATCCANGTFSSQELGRLRFIYLGCEKVVG